MKKIITTGVLGLLLFFSTSIYVNAQSLSSVHSVSVSEATVPVPSSVQFQISIPDNYSSQIIRENGDDAVYFKFGKSNGGTVFLFQVNKTSEDTWVKIKNQLSHPVLLDHKNGFIYYALKTDVNHLKGEDHDTYNSIYNQLDQIIKSVVITETGSN